MYLSEVLERKGRETVVTGEEISVASAAKLMCDSHVGAVVVIHPDGTVVGILTERDILRRFSEYGRELGGMSVADIMTCNVETASPDDLVQEALTRMTEKRFRHLPILENGELVGVVSIGDLVKATLTERTHEAESLREYISS